MAKIAVLGAGGWGTALSIVASANQHEVRLWAREKEVVDSVIEKRENPVFLPGIKIPESISISHDINMCLENADIVIFVTPSYAIRDMAAMIKGIIPPNACFISAAKGIEKGSLYRMSQVVQDELGVSSNKIAVLSGPNHAEEVGRGIPSATVIASDDLSLAQYLQNSIMSTNFRVYTTNDVIGVELAGAFKNIIALDAGASDGLGFGDNTRAALITRGLAEMARVGVAMGASFFTYAGLAGIGDLMATCNSKHSRNRNVGFQLAQGKTLSEIMSTMKMVAEGVNTAKIAVEFAEKFNVEMPLSITTHDVLFCNKGIKEAMVALLTRGPKSEIEEMNTIKEKLEHDMEKPQ